MMMITKSLNSNFSIKTVVSMPVLERLIRFFAGYIFNLKRSEIIVFFEKIG